MKRPIAIMCDVDDVLADFVGAAYAGHGICQNRAEPDSWELTKSMNMTHEEFWAPLSSFKFWYNIPLIPGAGEFVSMLNDIAPVCFMTQPQLQPSCSSAKVKWLHRHFGRDKYPIFLTLGPKSILANPVLLLIDDREFNIREWRKAGGRGVLFPQSWNRRKKVRSNKYELVLKDVRKFFK